MDTRATRFGSVLVMATCATLATVEALAAQGEPSGAPTAPTGDGRQSPARMTLEGFVLRPDGSPAEGAVVVSSAGGKAVTDAAGSYRLEVEVPRGAASVQVTATGRAGEDLAASASVAVSASTLPTVVDLIAQPSPSSCSPSWIPTFGGEPGFDRTVLAAATFDDGTGPALYVGGTFASAAGVPMSRIAKWDGSSWTALGSGMSSENHNTGVRALTVYDDGSGPALYVGGYFSSAGGVPASNIARWDGTSWSALGSGLNGGVGALVVYDDGSGPALYVGGGFTSAGGVPANSIAKWDGSLWTALGSGFDDGSVAALAVLDDGSGPTLFAGGQFGVAGGKMIAKWDGSTWTAPGGGMPDTEDKVSSLAVFDDGAGPALYVGGDFRGAGSLQVYGLAKWDGSSWAAVFDPDDRHDVSALAVLDDGTGPALYAAGSFDDGTLARWDGSSWTSLGFGNGRVFALAVHDDGGGPSLYAGGDFKNAGSVAASRIAKWEGSTWSALGGSAGAMNCEVGVLAAYDDGSGPALHAAIDFRSGSAAYRIVKWDGSSWAELRSRPHRRTARRDQLPRGIPGVPEVQALAVYDDGSGPALYAGGLDGSDGETGLAKWDGSRWARIGGAVHGGGRIQTLMVHDDGSGPALYVGGILTAPGLTAASRIARWNGASWSALGSGISGGGPVFALATYDDGGGPALYAAGSFTTAGWSPALRIARWNGASWAPLGSGIGGGPVLGLAVYDDGGGPALFACGSFTTAGGLPASNIARWDGSSWTALGSGTNDGVLALAVHDDGSGPALFAGGRFTIAGGMAANRIAKWDGTFWPVGSGVIGAGAYPWVHALMVYDDGDGPALLAGGSFSSAPDSGDSYLAKWNCADTTPPVLSCPSSIALLDRFLDGPGEVVTFTVTATDDLDPSPLVVCVPPSGSTFPAGTTLVDCTATDNSGNQSTCQFPVTVTPKARQR